MMVAPAFMTDQAYTLAERHRIAIASLRYPELPDKQQVTVSIGVALFEAEGGETSDDLLERADAALYMAKTTGRNRTVLAHEPRPLTVNPPGGMPSIMMNSATGQAGIDKMDRAMPSPEMSSQSTLDALEARLLRELDGGRASLPILPMPRPRLFDLPMTPTPICASWRPWSRAIPLSRLVSWRSRTRSSYARGAGLDHPRGDHSLGALGYPRPLVPSGLREFDGRDGALPRPRGRVVQAQCPHGARRAGH